MQKAFQPEFVVKIILDKSLLKTDMWLFWGSRDGAVAQWRTKQHLLHKGESPGNEVAPNSNSTTIEDPLASSLNVLKIS